jgi:GNAT superfamily N-acetyltransferase
VRVCSRPCEAGEVEDIECNCRCTGGGQPALINLAVNQDEGQINSHPASPVVKRSTGEIERGFKRNFKGIPLRNMPNILTDLSTPSLVTAIKDNWIDYYRYLGRSSQAEWHADAHLSWLLTGAQSHFMNVVLRSKLPSDRADELIAETLTHFRAKTITHVSWWLDPYTPDLEKHLSKHGLTFSEGGMGMAADLNDVPGSVPRSAPTDFKIIPVTDETTLREWNRTSSAGFGMSNTDNDALPQILADVVFDPPWRTYLGLLNDQPVATAQLFLSAGVAGIYSVTCLPEARNRGIGAAITLAPLLEARALGYRISILQASHLGAKVYRRLGFKEYGRLNEYLWTNTTREQ